MNINAGEIITLEDNKEYICLDVKQKDGNNYLFLMSNFKPVEVRFAREIITNSGIEIEIINDQAQKASLVELFKVQIPQ